ncbi:MAG: hypothetical protein WDN28_06555 [Chthoniobacter sp.]
MTRHTGVAGGLESGQDLGFQRASLGTTFGDDLANSLGNHRGGLLEDLTAKGRNLVMNFVHLLLQGCAPFLQREQRFETDSTR